MIDTKSITKLLIIFSIIYSLIVVTIAKVLPAIGISNISDMKVIFSISTIVEFIIIYLFSSGWRKVWKWFPVLNDKFFPDLNGEWFAEINWNWNGVQGKKLGKVFIKQSLITFSVNLETDESRSKTLLVKPFKDPESEQASFYYMYSSESKAINSDYNKEHKQSHEGAAILHLSLESNDELSGNYFTNRETFGHYVFKRKVK
ncbi:S_2TMBeta domain-containing protein [Vibrio chagasii]|nr:S_2TMBeta domain-containing protein [Vibrio chagasii]CAK2192996.1 SMODS-associating 2TM beta-strand rich effector domain-containing protein [Vibrio crassostreae]